MTRSRASQRNPQAASNKPLVETKPFTPTQAQLETYQATQHTAQRFAAQHHTWNTGVQKTSAQQQQQQKVIDLETVAQVQRLRGAYVQFRGNDLVCDSRAEFDAAISALASRVETPVSQTLGTLSDQYTQNLSLLRSKHSRFENNTWHDPKHPVINSVRTNSNALGTTYLRLRVSHQAKPQDLVNAITRLSAGVDRDRLLTGALARFGQHDPETGIVQRLMTEHETRERALEMQRTTSTLNLETAQRLAEHEIETPSLETTQRIQQQLGSGQTLPVRVQRMLEVALNTPKGTFANWGIHTGAEAKHLTQKLSAHAFNTGKDAFFGKALEFTNATDFALLAHEAQHHVQVLQGRVTGAGVDPDAGLEGEALAVQARVQADFSRIDATVPHNNQTASRTPTETWKDQAISNTTARFALRGTNPAWQALNQEVWGETTTTLPHLATSGTQGKHSDTHNHANPNPQARDALQYTSTTTGTYSVQRSSLSIQRFSIKEKISDFLGNIPGYKTLCAALGKDLVTGKAVRQDPRGILERLADIVPGPLRDMIKHLIESNALGKAWAWFKTELGKINIGAAWQGVKDGLGSFSVWKMNIGEVKNKIVAAVQKPIAQIKNLVVGCGKHVASIILECIGAGFGPAAQKLIAGLRGAGDVMTQVIKNPGAFVRNLVQSVKGGFNNFTTNAKTHLGKGLGAWLTGESGLAFPTNMDIRGVFTLTLSVLGITYANFRKQLATKLGEDKTKIAESKLELVQSLASKGMMLAEGMEGQSSNVKTEIIEGAKDMVKQSVIQSAVQKLVGMFIPGGGLVQLFITGFDMVKFFMNEGSRIMALINNVLGSVGAIAAGNIGGAVAKVEQSLAASIPLALGFLSKIFKVSGIGARVKSIMQKVKSKIDAVVARLMEKVAGLAAKLTGTTKADAPKPTTQQETTTLTKTEHDARVKAGLALIPNLEQKKLGKGGNLSNKAAAKSVAEQVMDQYGVGKPLGVFKSITPTFTGKSIQYHWVASSGSQPSTRSLAFVQFNLGSLRHELWPGAGRPNWKVGTKRDLSQEYPDEHQKDAAGNPTTSVVKGNDRRHIEAFDHIVTATVSKINNQTYDDAITDLKNMGAKITAQPAAYSEQVVKDGLKDHLTLEFNRMGNLFVGDAAENQQLGRQQESAEQARDKAKAAGNTQEVERQTRLFAENAVDVPKGKVGGKELTDVEDLYLNDIEGSSGKTYPSLSAALVQKIKSKQMAPTPEYRNAIGDFDSLGIRIRHLAAFSKAGSPQANQEIDAALKKAVAQQRRIADLLNGG